MGFRHARDGGLATYTTPTFEEARRSKKAKRTAARHKAEAVETGKFCGILADRD
jgi:hypothetical protein